jgi:methylthioribose-1-phosphate isomerase
MIPTIEWRDGIVKILDQTRLPFQVEVVDCKNYQMVARCIKELKIRGAPAIGVAGAMGVALGGQAIQAKDFDDFYQQLLPVCEDLANTRPTAVNLFWGINRVKKFVQAHQNTPVPELKRLMVEEAQRILKEDVERNRAIGAHGSSLIHDGDTILTHCNTGSLATAGYGTALGVIRSAWSEGKLIRVLVDETRPVLQGARLTVWELLQEEIPATLITDSMAGYFMKKGVVQLCLVGADRITANGDTANKIGTYGLAVLAKAHDIPFYVAAPVSTIDFNLASGDQIPIEERDRQEVIEVLGRPVAPKEIETANPAFDVTPARYITAIITDQGVFRPHELGRLRDAAAMNKNPAKSGSGI